MAQAQLFKNFRSFNQFTIQTLCSKSKDLFRFFEWTKLLFTFDSQTNTFTSQQKLVQGALRLNLQRKMFTQHESKEKSLNWNASAHKYNHVYVFLLAPAYIIDNNISHVIPIEWHLHLWANITLLNWLKIT